MQKTYVNSRDPTKVPVEMNSSAKEAKLAVEEMRMQLQTQLDPQSVENLFFDTHGSAEGCNEIKLAINLRLISQYNFE